ncbi:MAG: DoxX family protein [Acidimicrobiales bacterium]
MRDSTLLGLRLTLGGYLMVHGAQKLFGTFDGPGLEKAGAGFERMGLRPGKAFAALAGGAEFTGGILTATGAAYPVGPVALAGAMSVATLVHSDKGPMMQKGGFELPATNLACAILLLGAGRDRYSFDRITGFRLPKGFATLTVLGAVAMTSYSATQVLKTKRDAAAAFPPPAPEPAAAEDTSKPGEDTAAEAGAGPSA